MGKGKDGIEGFKRVLSTPRYSAWFGSTRHQSHRSEFSRPIPKVGATPEMQLKLTELLVSYDHIANRRIDFIQIIVNFRLTGKYC
jgi:hypothetical protein